MRRGLPFCSDRKLEEGAQTLGDVGAVDDLVALIGEAVLFHRVLISVRCLLAQYAISQGCRH